MVVIERKQITQMTRAKCAEIYAQCGLAASLEPEDVRRVVVLLGASRSGSSYLFSLLSESGAFWSPQGEETPFCRLADFGWVEKTNSSDQWAPPWPPSQLRELGQLLLRDLGPAMN